MSVDNTKTERIDTPIIINFDDWPEDPFAITKETDASTYLYSNSEGVETKPSSYFSPGASLKGVEDNINVNTSNNIIVNNSASTSRKRKSSQQSASISRPKTKSIGFLKKPKRPLSGYNLYFQAERTKILANQKPGFQKLGKIIGQQWRDLSNDAKKTYDKLAEKDSERYREEMDNYNRMKAKRYEEEEKQAAIEPPIVSSITDTDTYTGTENVAGNMELSHIPRTSSFYSIDYANPKAAIKVVPVGDRFVNSHLLKYSSKIPLASILSVDKQTYVPRSYAVRQQSNAIDVIHRLESPCSETSINKICQMPPGMEIILSDQNGVDVKYRLQYTCYSMTRENAKKYIESLTVATPSTSI